MPKRRFPTPEAAKAMLEEEPFVLALWVALALLFAGVSMVLVVKGLLMFLDPTLVGIALYSIGYTVGHNKKKD